MKVQWTICLTRKHYDAVHAATCCNVLFECCNSLNCPNLCCACTASYVALRPALDESGGFLTRQGRVIPSALEMLMAELSLEEEETMARRKKKDAARALIMALSVCGAFREAFHICLIS